MGKGKTTTKNIKKPQMRTKSTKKKYCSYPTGWRPRRLKARGRHLSKKKIHENQYNNI